MRTLLIWIISCSLIGSSFSLHQAQAQTPSSDNNIQHSGVELGPEQLQEKELMERLQRVLGSNATVLDVNEKIFTKKDFIPFVKSRFKESVTHYPPETVNFILANIIVAYTKCYGLNVGESIYKAKNTDPVCIQNLMEMMSSPLFYGGFFMFMIGSRYSSPIALKTFQAIGSWRKSRGKSVMSLKTAQFWSGQIGMAFGFMFDQIFHKFAENKMLQKCTEHVFKRIVSIDDSDGEGQLKVFNDKPRYCAKAYRELMTSQQSADQFVPALSSMLIAAYINGLITPRLLGVSGLGVKFLGGVSKPVAEKILGQLLSTGQIRWVMHITQSGALRLGLMVGGVTNLAMFIAISEIVGHFLTPAWKITKGTWNFRSQIKDLNGSFEQYLNDEMYVEAKCPNDYQAGELVEETGLCSRVPTVAELRTFHSYQKAWRQQHILEGFNTSYQGWVKKWNQFHTGYLATKDLLQSISQFREHRHTGKIQSLIDGQSSFDEYFEEKLEEAALATGRDKEELRQRTIELYENRGLQGDDVEAFLRYNYSNSQDSQKLMESYDYENPLFFVGSEKNKIDHGYVDKIIDELNKEYKKMRQRAFFQLSDVDKENYLTIEKILKDQSVSTSRLERAQRVKSEIEDKIDQIENRIWNDHTVADYYYNEFSRISGQYVMPREERIGFQWAKKVIQEYKNLEEKDHFQLSYAFLTLQKLSRILPITDEKKRVSILLSTFKPYYKYSGLYERTQIQYAQLADFNKPDFFYSFDMSEEILDSHEVDADEESGEKFEKFWKRAPRPFANADLYDYVLTSVLCNGDERYRLKPDEGFSLEFNTPILTNSKNICERSIYLDNWYGEQLNMSVKTSLFLDSDQFFSRGLMEVAIFDDKLMTFMNSEADFQNWWNTNIYKEAIPIVQNMGDRYRDVVSSELLIKIKRNPEALQRAIEGAQTLVDWSYTENFSKNVDLFFYYLYRDMVQDTTLALFDEEKRHSDFAQSGDLFEAFASEFGVLANYLHLGLQKWNEAGAEVARVQEVLDPVSQLLPQEFVSGFESQNIEIEIEINREAGGAAQENSVQLLSGSIKNIKQTFIDVLKHWDSVNTSKYYQKRGELKSQLESLAQLIVPADNALDVVEKLQERRDTEIYENTADKMAEYLIKRKSPMVVLATMSEIMFELESLRNMRMAQSFKFDLEE